MTGQLTEVLIALTIGLVNVGGAFLLRAVSKLLAARTSELDSKLLQQVAEDAVSFAEETARTVALSGQEKLQAALTLASERLREAGIVNSDPVLVGMIHANLNGRRNAWDLGESTQDLEALEDLFGYGETPVPNEPTPSGPDTGWRDYEEEPPVAGEGEGSG